MRFWSYAKDVLSGRRSMGKAIWDATRGCRTVRVALMGSKGSGKTVFLTSLANHLRDHRPTELPLGGRIVTWDKYAISGDTLHGLPMFDYAEARGFLSRGEWPRKTTESSILALRLLVEDKDGNQETVQLEVVDVPGERIADFAMKGRSYREWCRWMQHESANSSYSAYLADVEKIAKSGQIGDAEIEAVFKAYRDFIGREYESFAPCITPSVVKLGIDGERRGGRSPEEFRAAIDNVPIGFTDDKGVVWQFVPLPEKCFVKGSPWSKMLGRCEEAYGKYVRKIVRPVADWMAGADKLFYLVDMLSLLESGAKACDSERQYGEAAISALCKKNAGFLKIAMRTFFLPWSFLLNWRSQINAAYVVVTKADCVWSQANRDNLVMLADALFGRVLRLLDKKRTKSGILPCAAVCSTKERTDGEPGLQGKIDDPDHPEQPPVLMKWKPSDVPSALPPSSEEWQQMIDDGKFDYRCAFPWFDEAQICPPKHINLNLLVEAMLAR